MRRDKVFLPVFCTVFLIVALTIGSWTAVFAEEVLGATSNPDHITLTLEGNPGTTQTITWRTDVATMTGQVQYMDMTEANTFPHNVITVSAEVDELSTNLGDMHIHSVTLAGLKPGIRYQYRVGGETGWSSWRTFTTLASEMSNFKFLVFGDSQSINYNVWRTTLHQAYQTNAGAAFFINVGDLVDTGQDYAQWNAWFAAADGVVDNIPIMPVTGNHEYYTPERRFLLPGFFTAQFKLPDNGPAGLRGQVYSFDYGDVHFSMLDSQGSEGERFVPAMLERQQAWLENDLKMTNKKWKIAFLHRPPYSNKMTGGSENVRKAFVPIFDKYHVDVVFSGHDHGYARTYPLHGDVLVDNVTNGTVYIAAGRSGTKTYKDTVVNNWDEFFYNPLDEPNYLTVEVRNDILTVKAFKQSGALMDTWTVNKINGK